MEHNIYALDKIFEALSIGDQIKKTEACGLNNVLNEMQYPIPKLEKKLTISNFENPESVTSSLAKDIILSLEECLNKKTLV